MIFIVQVAIIGTWTWVSDVRAERLYEHSLTSLEQVTRLGRNIDQQRILVDDHILENEPSGMAQIENQLSRPRPTSMRQTGPTVRWSGHRMRKLRGGKLRF